MRNVLICMAGMLLLLSSCGSYAGMGAYTGSSIGSILGSAIGGLSGGARGADIGTIVGMAGGAVVGGAIGSAADRSRVQRYEGVRNNITPNKADGLYSQYDSGYDPMGNGNDVIEFETGDVSSSVSSVYPSIEISNVRFADTSRDRVICRNETACLSFEVYNRGTSSVYNIQPIVVETTGNKHLIVSPGIRVEEIAPGRGIRYTAMVKADNKLKEGVAIFSVSVGQGNRIVSQAKDLQIKTSK